MNLFGFGKKKEAAEVQEVVIEPAVVDKVALRERGIRRGQWVMTADGVGVVTGIEVDGIIVGLVKEDGNNKMKLDENDKAVADVIKTFDLSPATEDQIPQSRRGV